MFHTQIFFHHLSDVLFPNELPSLLKSWTFRRIDRKEDNYRRYEKLSDFLMFPYLVRSVYKQDSGKRSGEGQKICQILIDKL